MQEARNGGAVEFAPEAVAIGGDQCGLMWGSREFSGMELELERVAALDLGGDRLYNGWAVQLDTAWSWMLSLVDSSGRCGRSDKPDDMDHAVTDKEA